MNEMPVDWLEQLKREYPRRSGPMSWPRVFLKLRRALFETNWEQIMEGVRRYAKYCQEAGTEGSSFVVTPARFFEDEIYLEDLKFEPPQTKEEIERGRIRAADERRYVVAKEAAKRYGLTPSPGEPVGSFETRVELARQGISAEGRRHSPDYPQVERPRVDARISDLANRMRIAK